jgi:hypothetical protein
MKTTYAGRKMASLTAIALGVLVGVELLEAGIGVEVAAIVAMAATYALNFQFSSNCNDADTKD